MELAHHHVRARAREICVHSGFRVRAALCAQRLPLAYSEPAAAADWRKFREEWEDRTACASALGDSLLYTNYPTQFMLTAEQLRRKHIQIAATGDETVSELDHLMLEEREGIIKRTSAPVEHRRDIVKRKNKQEQPNNSNNKKEEATDVCNPKRLPDRLLHLLVEDLEIDEGTNFKKRKWKFPSSHLNPKNSMRHTIDQICANHSVHAHILSLCPIAVGRRRSNRFENIQGDKTFYYRGYVLPSDMLSGYNKEYAWVTRSELHELVSAREFAAVRDSLPFDS